jgi:hypothetical protein
MLINFTDTYVNDIFTGFQLIGRIQSVLASREPFMGNSPALDKLYAQSIVISGIIDHLSNDDNSNPKENEALLLCLRSLINKEICGPLPPRVRDVKNYHNLSLRPSSSGQTQLPLIS